MLKVLTGLLVASVIGLTSLPANAGMMWHHHRHHHHHHHHMMMHHMMMH